MKLAEWNCRIPLDLKGVQLLGAALLLNARMQRKFAEDRERQRKEADENPETLNEFEWLYEVEYFERERKRRQRTEHEIMWRLDVLETPKNAFDTAKSLSAKDFRFRWDQLMAQKSLMAFITDDQPDWCANWDRETPISKRWGNEVTGLLEPIFFAEFERLTGKDPDFVPYLREASEFEFHLAAWKLCEPESGRGQPKGRRWPDGLSNAASYAYSIRKEAQEKGAPISIEAAISESLEKFKIMGEQEFWDYPEKSEAIVCNAGHGEDERRNAVKMQIRKLLLKWEKDEKTGM